MYCQCGCGRVTNKHGNKHFRYIYGHQLVGKTGPQSFGWNGGRIIHEGYVLLYRPDHREADKRNYVKEHRLVYEEFYNVCLLPWTLIHHLNNIRDDNRPENLEAVTRGQHCKIHGPDYRADMTNRKCLQCGSNKTYINKKGWAYWVKVKDGFLCNRCDSKRKTYTGHKKDMSSRLCLECGGKTIVDKNGQESWFRYLDGFMCKNCWRHKDFVKPDKEDISKRVCVTCGSNKTYVNKKGWPHWHKYNGGYRCTPCYKKHND